MGLEENINKILQLSFEIRQALEAFQNPAQITAGVESSVNSLSTQLTTLQENFRADLATVLQEARKSSQEVTAGVGDSLNDLSMQLTVLQEKFRIDLESVLQEAKDTAKGISPDTIDAIARLPPVLANLEETFSTLSKTLDVATKEMKDDLKFIKVSYVEDVVGVIRNLSQELSNTLTSTTERTEKKFEASVDSFTRIDEGLKNAVSSLNALIENQTDQLATIAELRDRVNAIIQVELATLKDRITIYLESSVNELKTSVNERMAMQDSNIRKLTETNQQLTQTLAALPQVLNQDINTAVETKIVSEIKAMKKEMKKMTAFIIKAQRSAE